MMTRGMRVPVLVSAFAAAVALGVASSGSAGENGQTCNGEDADVVLQGGSDTHYVGTAGPDVVVGSSDDDHIRTRGGRDIVCAGFGQDRISGGRQSDQLFGEEDSDVIRGRQHLDFIDGGSSFNKRGNGDLDYCIGGRPRPDTEARHDTATNCEQVTSAFTVKTPVP